jgi:phospholipase C
MAEQERPPEGDGTSEPTAPDTNATRRGVLKAGLIAGAAVGVGGWQSAAAEPAARTARPAARLTTAHLRAPGSMPYPDRPMGTDTIPQIDHVVVLMMENHSYDNKLGMLNRPGADGFSIGKDGKPTATNPYPNGDLQHAFRMPTTCQNTKPSQAWIASHQQYANGRNDGFVKSPSGPVAMGYWQWADQPFYYSMARLFPIADRYFCSVLGQTFPNRRYLISATSLGMVNDGVPDPSQYPKNGTIFDRLDKAKVSWKDYYSTLSTTELYPKLFLANVGKKVVTLDHFFTDAASGKLPSFSLVDPNFETASEEDPQNIVVGEHFAAKVINAVMSGPKWASTLLIWTYDEHGGYFDHVPPPAAIAPDDIKPEAPADQQYGGFTRYGFRVPCAIISPWARANYVSHMVFDHTSICALVEAKWNLPAMTHRDANANTMLDMLDFSAPAFAKPPKLAEPLLTQHPFKSQRCDLTGPGTIPPPGSVTPAGLPRPAENPRNG